jgi:hypothetical protein
MSESSQRQCAIPGGGGGTHQHIGTNRLDLGKRRIRTQYYALHSGALALTYHISIFTVSS